ncbi:hypothetical protein EGR_04860 [Echinococcus granulosus]|uniref:Uncharacterized protein n=1 Tax=Echinococcus granulosus TaxID=6210 RepID=W6UPT9_ECHGR|nr:hypothetical protein EGR_04860 [Echinococcus granulosus]EUB60302.1 hypothetical protein EGR_04860 [Echinococcus granulosus]
MSPVSNSSRANWTRNPRLICPTYCCQLLTESAFVGLFYLERCTIKIVVPNLSISSINILLDKFLTNKCSSKDVFLASWLYLSFKGALMKLQGTDFQRFLSVTRH